MIHWIMEKEENSRRILVLLHYYAKAFDYVDHNKLWKTLKEKGIPDHLTCLLRNLYAGQEATVRTRRKPGLVQNWERTMSRLYINPLLIELICRVHHEKCQAG